MARLRIQNYGIGIPQHVLEALRADEIGVRGEVEDDRRSRDGTGWGIAIARRAFAEAGGFFNINSWPSETAKKQGVTDFHRYITEVQCDLPIQE